MSSEHPVAHELKKEFILAAHGDLEKVKALYVQHRELVKVIYDWGPGGMETPLGAAAHVGNREIAEFLLDHNARMTIFAAAMLGRADEVQALLEAQPTLANAKGAHGIPVMFHAAMSGLLDVAILLRDHGCRQGYDDALFGAIKFGHLNMVEWLLANGARNLSVRNFAGQTPLEAATKGGRHDIAHLLRQHGATA